jgi:hypothetical protein
MITIPGPFLQSGVAHSTVFSQASGVEFGCGTSDVPCTGVWEGETAMGGALEKYVAVAAIAALKIVAMTGRMIANFFQRSVSLSKGPAGYWLSSPHAMQKSLNFFGIALCTKSRISRTCPSGPVTRNVTSNISRLFFDTALMTLIRQPAYQPSRHGLAVSTATAPASVRGSNFKPPGRGQPPLPSSRRLAAHSTHSIAQLNGARSQIGKATTDRAACNPGRSRHRCHPAASCGTGFTRGKQAAFSLVQEWRKRTEASRDRGGIDHAPRVDEPASTSLRIMDPFVASLPPCRFFPSDSVAQAQALSAVSTDAPVRVIMMKRAASSAVALSAECCQQPRGRLLGSLTRPVAATLRHPRADFDKSASTTSIKVDQSDISALAIFHIAP